MEGFNSLVVDPDNGFAYVLQIMGDLFTQFFNLELPTKMFGFPTTIGNLFLYILAVYIIFESMIHFLGQHDESYSSEKLKSNNSKSNDSSGS